MSKGVRIALWILSSLAVLWTASALVMAGSMSAMMASGSCPMCGIGVSGGGVTGAQGADGIGQEGTMPAGTTGDRGMASGMMGSGMGVGSMMWMMLTTGLTWLVMLGLDAVFAYLAVTALRDRRSAGVPTA